MLEITTEPDFQKEVLENKMPVLIDFFAEWCAPCKAFAPVFEQVAAEKKEIHFCKIDTAKLGDLSDKYGVSAIPALLLFKEGKVIAERVGALKKNPLIKWIDEQLK